MRVTNVTALALGLGMLCAGNALAAEITLTNSVGGACSSTSVHSDVANTVPLQTPCVTGVFTGSAVSTSSFIDSALTFGTASSLSITTRDLDYYTAFARAMFEDTVVSTFTGFADFSFEVEGSAACSTACDLFAGPWAGMDLYANGTFFFSYYPTSGPLNVLSPTVVVYSLPVTAGMPVDLDIRMYAYAHIENAFPGRTASADFLNTATLLSVVAYGVDRQRLATGNLVSEGGLTYPMAQDVAEPSTLLLLVAGAVTGLLARRGGR